MAEKPGPAKLPYPHSRNDCMACRERDADGELRDNPARPSRLCRTCIGNYVALTVLQTQKPVTVHPLTEDHRVYTIDPGARP